MSWNASRSPRFLPRKPPPNATSIPLRPRAAGSRTFSSPEPRMPVGLLTLELHIQHAQSLKDKRQVLRSLQDRLRAKFNVAVAELEHQDTWQRSVVGVVTLSNEEHQVRESLQHVLAEADNILGPLLVSHGVEII